jgi:hypothetical protein
MRHRFLLLFLMLSLSACTFQVEMLTPTTDVLTPTPLSTEIFILTPFFTNTPSSSELPTQSPTATPPPIPTFTSTALPPGEGTYPIQFVANGTFIDIVDSIPAGKSKTYSINALKDQVMSISIRQSSDGEWTYIPMEIKGADGTTFCPLLHNVDCTFWRGELPASQDYFVKISPVADALNFTMRVAINPPGMATQSFKFASRNISFSYDDDFAPVRFPGAPIYKIEPEFALQYIDTKAYANTNLLEAYFLLGSTTQNDILQSCTQPASLGGPENIVGNVDINGINFTRSEATGVATGNIYEQIYHRAVVGDSCYEVTFFIHSTNIGVYAPDAGVKEFDRAALLQRFEDTLSTLVIQ